MAINTTKTYDFNPSAGELLLEAFSRCGIRPTEPTTTQLKRGEVVLNLILAEISNLQPNLWEVELKSIPLGAGIATYSLPSEIVEITDLYIRTGTGTSAIDRYITRLSRTDYAALSNKNQQGFPNQFWFDRSISPKITFYFVPDSGGPYVARYYSVRQTQDVQLSGGDTVEIPYRYLPAYVAGVAWGLSKHFAPQQTEALFGDYMRLRTEAQAQDTENVALMIVPGTAGYWR